MHGYKNLCDMRSNFWLASTLRSTRGGTRSGKRVARSTRFDLSGTLRWLRSRKKKSGKQEGQRKVVISQFQAWNWSVKKGALCNAERHPSKRKKKWAWKGLVLVYLWVSTAICVCQIIFRLNSVGAKKKKKKQTTKIFANFQRVANPSLFSRAKLTGTTRERRITAINSN